MLLPGHPCLVAAVERRVFLEGERTAAWAARAGEVRWGEGRPAPEGLGFLVAAFDAVHENADPEPLSVVTRDELAVDGRKLGLGGSAAATVAAVWAAAESTGLDARAKWQIADASHRARQWGKGSGADIAASVHGGVLRYTRDPLSAVRIPVHDGFRFLLAWGGESAKTEPRLERWKAFVRDAPREAKGFGLASTMAVTMLERALSSGEFQQARSAVVQARAALRGLEASMGLELETPALRTAADAAWDSGAVGKLSGAGGGDCAIVIAWGEAGRDRAREVIEAHGVETFPIELAKEGVRVHREE